MIVRSERPEDIDAIRRVNVDAFAGHPFSQQTEHLIVDALRTAAALELSLVAEEAGEVIGHVAFSACRIGEATRGWMLLGPIAVAPAHQGRGVGRALVEAGLTGIRERGAVGCALVGDPAFYGRFGFRHHPGVTCDGVPHEYVLCLSFGGAVPVGEIEHHAAFSVEG